MEKMSDGETNNWTDFLVTCKDNPVKNVTVLKRFAKGSDHRMVQVKIVIDVSKEWHKLIRRGASKTSLSSPSDITSLQPTITDMLNDAKPEGIKWFRGEHYKSLARESKHILPSNSKLKKKLDVVLRVLQAYHIDYRYFKLIQNNYKNITMLVKLHANTNSTQILAVRYAIVCHLINLSPFRAFKMLDWEKKNTHI